MSHTETPDSGHVGGLRCDSAPAGSRFAFKLILAHVAVLVSLGQIYAKAELGLYPTEVLLIVATVFGLGAIRQVPADTITKIVVLFAAIGLGWVVLGGGLGSTGAGEKAFSFFVYTMFYFLFRGAAVNDRRREQVLLAMALGCVAGASLGLWQVHSGTPVFDESITPFSATTTGSIRWLSGEYGLYGMLGFIIAAARAIEQRRVTRRSAVLLGGAAVVLVLAQHRSGFVALAAAMLATGFFLIGSRQALRGALKVVVLAVVGIGGFMLLFSGSYLNETLVRLQHTGDMTDANTIWRLAAWLEVLSGVMRDPMGHGFARWDFFFTLDDPLSGSHNSFIDLAYRIGVPGLLVFLALPAVLTIKTRRLVQMSSPRAQVLPITVCACLLAFLPYAFFNVVFEVPYMSVFFWILLGLGAGAIAERSVAATPTAQAAN